MGFHEWISRVIRSHQIRTSSVRFNFKAEDAGSRAYISNDKCTQCFWFPRVSSCPNRQFHVWKWNMGLSFGPQPRLRRPSVECGPPHAKQEDFKSYAQKLWHPSTRKRIIRREAASFHTWDQYGLVKSRARRRLFEIRGHPKTAIRIKPKAQTRSIPVLFGQQSGLLSEAKIKVLPEMETKRRYGALAEIQGLG